MADVVLFKASPIGGKDTPTVTIQIGPDSPPDFSCDLNWENRSKNAYREEARDLMRVLSRSLPGATLDALLVELLDHTRSTLRVASITSESTA